MFKKLWLLFHVPLVSVSFHAVLCKYLETTFWLRCMAPCFSCSCGCLRIARTSPSWTSSNSRVNVKDASPRFFRKGAAELYKPG